MNDIKAGDLVMVVYECCDASSDLGKVLTVISVETVYGECEFCGASSTEPTALMIYDDYPMPYGVPLPWLKKIPPLCELEVADSEMMGFL